MRPSRAPARAFTLVEAIIAIVILSIAMPPMLWALSEASMRRTSPISSGAAGWLAAEKLEEIIADRHSPARGYDWIIPVNYPHEPAVSGFARFQRSVQILETAADLTRPGEGYKRITVIVSWSDRAGARSLSISTILTDYPS